VTDYERLRGSSSPTLAHVFPDENQLISVNSLKYSIFIFQTCPTWIFCWSARKEAASINIKLTKAASLYFNVSSDARQSSPPEVLSLPTMSLSLLPYCSNKVNTSNETLQHEPLQSNRTEYQAASITPTMLSPPASIIANSISRSSSTCYADISRILSASFVTLFVDLRLFTAMARALAWPIMMTSFLPLVTAV